MSSEGPRRPLATGGRFIPRLDLSVAHWKGIAKIAPWQMTQTNLNTFARHGASERRRTTTEGTERLRDEALLKEARVAEDPLEGLVKAEEKHAAKVHPRRALSEGDVAALLAAALRRPEVELLLIRRGKDKGQLKAKARPKMLERARQLGVDRRLAYLVAYWSGLRRAELEALQWRDVRLRAAVPYFQLRAATTKSDRADVVPLHRQIADELLAASPSARSPRIASSPWFRALRS